MGENYKIKVNNEAESKEAQELFFELGYSWPLGKVEIKYIDEPSLIATLNGISFCGDMDHFHKFDAKELTLPQLRDLVVLHRNDLNDRTHIYTTSTGEDLSAILLGDWWHIFTGGSWQKFTHKDSEKSLLMDRIQLTESEQGLISGADAKLAWAKGEIIEYSYVGDWCEIDAKTEIGIFDRKDIALRIKPHSITLNLEIPAPFEPKKGDLFWHISPEYMIGYGESMYNDGNVDTWQQFGAWRTEEEIKQVVAALRSVFK